MKITNKLIDKIIFMLTHNPIQLLKIISKRILPLPKSPIQRKINGVFFEFDFDFEPAMKQMYFGTYEIETIEAIRKYLKNGDVFIDVGANIGYISTIALGIVGKNGEVHSFEPVPKYFSRLKKGAKTNIDYTHIVNQYALGEGDGTATIAITNLPNIGWNTIVPGYMSNETVKEKIEVPVKRLDNYIKEKSLEDIALIKIDTEGYEFPVLRGLSNYFENTNFRPIIICEIAPSAYPFLGYSLHQLSEYMKKYGYRAFDLIDISAEIDISTLETSTNVLFRPDKGVPING